MIEYIVIAGYLAFLIAMGLVFRSFNSNVSDYFRSGCKGTWWLVGASAFMGVFSAWTFTGAAGSAFESGWSILIIFLGNVVAFAVHALLLAPWFRQLRAVTAPEVIRKRFGPGTQQVYAWLYAILGMLQAAVWLWSLAVFIAAVFDWTGIAKSVGMSEVQFVIAVVGIVVLTYSVSGGSWAVMATDVIQSIVLFPLTILVAILCLREIGGIGELFHRIDEAGLTRHFSLISPPGELQPKQDHPDFWKYTMIFAWATIIYKVVTFSTIDVAQKYFGVKDGREARKAALLAGGLMLFGMCFWFIPPIVARLLWSDDVMAMQLSKPAEGAYAVAGLKVLPAGMVGLMIVSMLSATMSSMDSGLNKNAAVFTRDIIPFFQRITGKAEFSDKASFLIGQITSTILGITIIGIALYFAAQTNGSGGGKGVFEMMLDIGAMLSLPMAVPLALGLFIRRVPTWSAAISVTAGVIPSAIAYFAAKDAFSDQLVSSLPGFLAPLFDGGWPYHLKVFINLGVGVAAFLLTMPFWPKVSDSTRQRTDEFFETMHKPVDFAAEVGEANDSKQLTVIGAFTAAVGGGIALLILIPSHTWGDRLSVLFVSVVVLLTGVGLIWAGKRNQSA
ncbi:MAG: hypothetical protein KDA31_14735 [Phycisphaerales bacterium]|nr:hypothetical protein [Phycisphaerales bacterium]MCB9837123.1 hypothetical protein [Phycisphaera sp.]